MLIFLFDASTCTVSSINTTNLFLLVCFTLMVIVSETAVMSRFRHLRAEWQVQRGTGLNIVTDATF